jgi:hypothetical protein
MKNIIISGNEIRGFYCPKKMIKNIRSDLSL